MSGSTKSDLDQKSRNVYNITIPTSKSHSKFPVNIFTMKCIVMSMYMNYVKSSERFIYYVPREKKNIAIEGGMVVIIRGGV